VLAVAQLARGLKSPLQAEARSTKST